MATLVEAPEDVVASLERKVVDAATSLPEKYRVLFSLRNVAGTAATQALITGGCGTGAVHTGVTALHTPGTRPVRAAAANAHTHTHTACPQAAPPPPHIPDPANAALKDQSDLFRHDVAFCLGQRQDATAVAVLKSLVADGSQHPM